MIQRTASPQPRRRRWRRVLWRCLLLIVLVWVAAYATLPWWAPKEYLRRRLTERLARQLGLAVSIGSLSLDWGEGVDIRNVTIASPEGFSPAPMVRIDRITADLSPITYLLTSRLNRLNVTGLRLSVEFDGAGRWNVAPLGAMSAAPVASRVNVREASATFQTPHQGNLLNLAVSELDLQTLAHRPLVRITMSAKLAQADQPAPVRFRLSEGDGQDTVAVAAMEFSDLDLGGLPLRVLLPDLPLRECAGRAQGWAELRIDSQGMISRCNADVSVRGLDIQPLEGPRLPVVEQAGVGLRASVDPITGRVWVRRLDVRLPGAELVGDGEFSAELMAGRWEAIQRLNLTGRLQPVELAALLTGSATLPAGLELDGPLDVRLAGRSDGTHLGLDIAADGDSLSVRRSGRMIKPAGRALTVALAGELDRRNWRFAAERAELVWGGNRFSGSGVVDDIRQPAPAAAAGGGVWSAVLARLAACDGHGQCQIADWVSLNDLLAGCDCPTRLWAAGPVSGRWFLDRTGPPRIHLRAEAGPEARLRIGEVFAQPQAAAVVADLAGVIDGENGGVGDLVADLTVGTGRLTLDRGELRQRRETSSPSPVVVFQGQFEARAMESLAAALPMLRRWGITMGGAMSGDALVEFRPGGADGVFGCAMDSATLTVGRAFTKAPGQRAGGEFRFTTGQSVPSRLSCRLSAWGSVEGGEASALVALARAPSTGGTVFVDVHVRDAARLTGNLPLLTDALAGAHLEGQAELSAWARWEGPLLEGRLRCNADGIEYASAGSPRRVKAAGEALAAELSGQVTRQGEGDFDFAVDQLRLAGRNHKAILRGSGALRGLQFGPSDARELRVARADLTLTALQGTIAGKTIAAAGPAVLERVSWPAGGALAVDYLGTDGLELRVGDNGAWLLADLTMPPRGLSGQFHLLAASLDDKDIADWIDELRHMGCVRSDTATSLPAPPPQEVYAEADRRIDSARRALAQVALEGRISIERLRTFDAQVDRSYVARRVEANVAIDRGRVSGDLQAAVYGGIISRAYALDLADAAPHLSVRSEIRDLMANDDVQPLLNWFFPGNTVYDLFTREDELAFPLQRLVAGAIDSSVPVYPVGRAKTVATNGMLQGRAAPSYVTRIFPGLNLARYRYDRMTAFAEYEPDGTAVNDMVFSGKTYDVYIEGSTDADRQGRYEIGVILLGSPQSAEWNHTYRQGRIPILKVKARIEGGRMHDETVAYPYPTQSLFTIFLKNNIFYRLWLASRR